MRYGICLANIGTYSDPRVATELAREAEGAGWDGMFLWDHLAFVWGPPAADPWVTLGAIAVATQRIRIGTMVTPIARRRPQVLAQQIATLDVLSRGRVIFGAGLGGSRSEFTKFGEPAEDAVRAEVLDEGLDVVRALWSGQEVHHHGTHFTVDGVTLAPTPVQKHVPIWIGGNRPASLRRASRWDGWCGDSSDPTGTTLSPDDVRARIDMIGRSDTFDVAVLGQSDIASPDKYEHAGATWWLENVHDRRGTLDDMRAVVRRGPA